jgi:hypothetical protein
MLTSYGSFFLVLNDGIEPSFCVSAQWKMSWYSLGLSNWVGMLNPVAVRELTLLVLGVDSQYALDREHKRKSSGGYNE